VDDIGGSAVDAAGIAYLKTAPVPDWSGSVKNQSLFETETVDEPGMITGSSDR
jgi:hypothetical protein